jgi:hypothetical protein
MVAELCSSPKMKSLLWVACLLSGVVDALLVSRRVSVGGVDFFIPPDAVGTLSVQSNSGSNLDAITIIRAATDEGSIRQKLDTFNSTDDVWNSAFASTIVLQNSSISSSPLQDCGVARVLQASTDLPEGPYFLDNLGNLFQAYRLYPDTNQAFLQVS